MRVSMYFISTASLSLFTFLFATSSLAQTATTGAIVGRVNDTDGMGVPNVTFTVTSVSLIRPQSATSGKEGNVLIPNLPPGKYTVSANAGIIASERHGVEVNISRTSSVLILLRRRLENNSTAGIDQHRLSLERSFGLQTLLKEFPVNNREVSLLNGVQSVFSKRGFTSCQLFLAR